MQGLPNISDTIEKLKKEGLWICGTDINTDKYYYEQDLTGPIGIVIGNEGNGMSNKVTKKCDFLVKIPMLGKVTSLNASVSTGIVVYEALKQRLPKEGRINMATKKKKITIAIIIVIFVILVISGVCIALYINTDMFKSNEVLFAKYLGQNLENIKLLETTLENTSYNETLDNSFYNTNIEAEAKYTQAIGTSSESSDNSINQLKITLEGQTDKINGYNYKNLKLLKNEEQVAQINRYTYRIIMELDFLIYLINI